MIKLALGQAAATRFYRCLKTWLVFANSNLNCYHGLCTNYFVSALKRGEARRYADYRELHR